MEQGFAGQFLAQVWPIIAFILGMIGLMVGILVWQARQRVIAQQKKRAEIDGTVEKKSKSAKSNIVSDDWNEPISDPEPFSSILDEYDDPLEANRLSDLLSEPEEEFETFTAESIEGDDPLAELYQARDVAEKERSLQEDEEIVQLASLLAGLGDEEEEIVYHEIQDSPVRVKLENDNATRAQEQLSILRDERDERLIVQIGAVAFRTLLDDAEAKSTFTKVMKELSGIILKADESEDLEIPASDSANYHTVSSEPVHIKLHGGAETTALELMTVLRDERDGRLMLQIGDIAYRSLANEKQNKAIFTKTMKELAGIILTADDNPPQIASQQRPKTQERVPDNVAKIVQDAERYGEEEEIPGVINIPKMDDLPPTHSVGRFGRIQIKKPDEVPELNIAEAIEKYLQYKIERNPQFQKRGIHIRSGFGGGVRIDVDGNSYDFVDEIEDTEARNFIQQTINEWQDQH